MAGHCIDIEGTVNPRHPNIVKNLNIAISELHSFHPDCHIHKVNEGIRRAKPEAYEPIVVSIGPYHLQNHKLQATKNLKLRYLQLLLKRRKENVKKYIMAMEKLEDRVRNCYVEPIGDLNSEEFVEMMLLDACFIIEFFPNKHFNTLLDVDCMDVQICRDLMLLENQLPFFLLSHFYDMIKNSDGKPNNGRLGDPDHDLDDVPEYPKPDPDNNPNNGLEDPDHDPEYPKPDLGDLSLLELAFSSFLTIISPPYLKDSELAQTHDPEKIKHILHLVHACCCPLSKQMESSESINTKNDKLDDILKPMHSAVELKYARVKFKVTGENYRSNAHLFDIKFLDNGLMVVPCLPVDDSTDTFFRNLIAFEQHSKDIVPKYFTEYADFMDQLISSEKDVNLLRHEGIIENYLRDDKEVSNLFNHLCDGVIVTYPTSYDDVCRKANRHCNKPWNRMRATIAVRMPNYLANYFDTPLATISTIAGGVLLVLTLLQTIAAFKYK